MGYISFLVRGHRRCYARARSRANTGNSSIASGGGGEWPSTKRRPSASVTAPSTTGVGKAVRSMFARLVPSGQREPREPPRNEALAPEPTRSVSLTANARDVSRSASGLTAPVASEPTSLASYLGTAGLGTTQPSAAVAIQPDLYAQARAEQDPAGAPFYRVGDCRHPPPPPADVLPARHAEEGGGRLSGGDVLTRGLRRPGGGGGEGKLSAGVCAHAHVWTVSGAAPPVPLAGRRDSPDV